MPVGLGVAAARDRGRGVGLLGRGPHQPGQLPIAPLLQPARVGGDLGVHRHPVGQGQARGQGWTAEGDLALSGQLPLEAAQIDGALANVTTVTTGLVDVEVRLRMVLVAEVTS